VFFFSRKRLGRRSRGEDDDGRSLPRVWLVVFVAGPQTSRRWINVVNIQSTLAQKHFQISTSLLSLFFFNKLLEVVDIFRQHFSEVLPTFFRQYFSGVFATFFHQYFSGVFATIFSSTFFGSVTNNFRQHFQEV
jgi:hypothetical protein